MSYKQIKADLSCGHVPASTNEFMSSPTFDNSRKRIHSVIDENPTATELAKMSRSERKRHREKKRRNDVNRGFDELQALLNEIDCELRGADADVRDTCRHDKYQVANSEESFLSRVELITRTTQVLRRIHRENEERKLIVDRLLEQVTLPATVVTQETSQSNLSLIGMLKPCVRDLIRAKSDACTGAIQLRPAQNNIMQESKTPRAHPDNQGLFSVQPSFRNNSGSSISLLPSRSLLAESTASCLAGPETESPLSLLIKAKLSQSLAARHYLQHFQGQESRPVLRGNIY